MERPYAEPLAALSEYSRARAKMPECTHETLDRLHREILAICEAHGVHHPLKLGREGRRPAIETLKRVQDLLRDTLFIFEHKDLPENVEYVVPIENKNPTELIQVFHHHGQFLVLDRSSSPHCLYDHQGKKKMLSPGIDYQEFLFLGSQVVLSAEDEQEQKMITNLDGEIMLDEIGWVHDIDRHIDYVGKRLSSSSEVNFPVNEKGVVQWENPLSRRPYKTVLIAGRPSFIVHDHHGWHIYTTEGPMEAFPNAFRYRPVLFEKDGEPAVILFEDKGRSDGRWWIYDKNGQPVKEIETLFEIIKAVFMDGQYFFAGRTASGILVVFNEKNEKIYEGKSDEDEIEDLRLDRGKLLFLTKTVTPSDDGNEEASEVFYDENGKEIVRYEGYAPEQSLIAIGDGFAFIDLPPLETGEYKASLVYRDQKGNKIFLGTYKEIYALQAIDDHRFYAIVLEEKKRENFQKQENFQIAKRVYDLRDHI